MFPPIDDSIHDSKIKSMIQKRTISHFRDHLRLFNSIALLFLVSLLAAQKPNILLIISDDLNTRIGPYMEIDKHTPHLDRLAAEGIRFTRTSILFVVPQEPL